MQPLLPEVVYLGYSRCWKGRRGPGQRNDPWTTTRTTDRIQLIYDKSGIRPVVEELPLSLVPVETVCQKACGVELGGLVRTNLMATVCELSRFVPGEQKKCLEPGEAT